MIPAATPPPVAVGVALREWRVTVYRPAVRAGSVKFVIRNLGEDGHDLQVRGPRGYRSAATPEIRAGRNGVLRVRLRRTGRYRLVCTLPGHLRRGMSATLRVQRPKRSSKKRGTRGSRSARARR